MKFISSQKRLTCLLATAALTTATQAAVLVDLSFNDLPSTEGFTYQQAGPHADDSEMTQFSATSGILTQMTVGKGQGAGSPGRASYLRNFTPLETAGAINFRFEMTARVTASEQTRQDFSYAGFTNNIYINDEGFFMGIKPGELYINGTYFTPSGFDGTVFHDYRIDVDLVDSTFEFFLDGASVQTGSTATFPNSNLALFGDGTGTANADGQRSSFIVTTNIPEPSSVLLGLSSLALILQRRRP